MAQYVLQDAEIWMGGAMAQTYSNQMSMEMTMDAPNTTTFGQKWNYHIEDAVKASSFTVSGFRLANDDKFHFKRAYDLVSDNSWDKPSNANTGKYGEADLKWCFMFPEGTGGGKVCYGTRFQGTAYQEGMQLGDGMTWSMSGTGTGQLMRGRYIGQFGGLQSGSSSAYIPIPETILGDTTFDRSDLSVFVAFQTVDQADLSGSNPRSSNAIQIYESTNKDGTGSPAVQRTIALATIGHLQVYQLKNLKNVKYYGFRIASDVHIQMAMVTTKEIPLDYSAP